MITFAAIVPHPPILIPQIGKDNLNRLKDTILAFDKLKEALIKSEAETIFIISPHGLVQDTAFTMNLSPKFFANFEDFGDFATKKEWTGDVGLTYKIREALETHAPLQLITNENIDHGVSVPLMLLTEELKNIKIIPFYYSGLSCENHFSFGAVLRRELQKSKTKVAIIASGDLSHRLTKDAPAGYSPKGKKFDQKLIDFLQKKQPDKILEIDEKLINAAGECGLKSILILSGIMDNIGYTPRLLSYEGPFGVGYLVMNFEL